MLTLVPQGGLCNRLRAIMSVLSLVEEGHIDTDVRVGWQVNSECAARFDLLFQPLEATRLKISPRRWYDRPITRFNLHWPELLRSFLYFAQYSNVPPAVEELQGHIAAGRSIYVSTGQAFCEYDPQYVQRLRLQPHLQQRVNILSQHFDEHTIGVHIRRTDHVKAIAESPDNLFEQAMRQALESDPKANFFIASDDPHLRTHLAALFPGRATIQTCRGTRSDLQGMEEGVVDLWTLARCSRIMGSFWSSYSDTAAEIGGIPLTIIRKSETAKK